MCSRSLQYIEVREMGRISDGRVRSPFLKIGVMLACNHERGSSLLRLNHMTYIIH